MLMCFAAHMSSLCYILFVVLIVTIGPIKNNIYCVHVCDFLLFVHAALWYFKRSFLK